MKEKIAIAQELAKRKYKVNNGLVWTAYQIVGTFLATKYHVHYDIIDDPRKEKGPCFIVWNHLSRRDYLFLKKLISPKKFNMVAGYNEFFRKKFASVFKLVNVLPKKNFTNDPSGIRAINSIIKQGGCVAFAPEGMSSIYGHNQPVVPGTGRFLQFYRIPVYYMHVDGAYLTSHKTDIVDRPGRVNVSIKLLFSPDDLKSLSGQEIEDRLNIAFKHDDYEWNKKARVKYKIKDRAAYNLETICYKCPKCGKELAMVGEGNKLYCKECGNGVEIDEYYDFHLLHDDDKAPVSPSAWVDWEREEVIKEIRKNPNYSMSTNVKVGELPEYDLIEDKEASSVPCGEGKVTVDHTGMHFVGKKHGEDWSWDLDYKTLFSLVITNDTTCTGVYVDEKFYELFPDTKCIGKMLLVVEEMHRLHVNTWKNFPWCNYMYEGFDLEKK